MRTSLDVTAEPDLEPITTAQIQKHLRYDQADDLTDELALLGVSARMMAEAYLARTLITTTFLYTLAPETEWNETWGRHGPRKWHRLIELPRSPVQSIASIVLTDVEGTATTLDPSSYIVDLALKPATLRLDYRTGLIPDGVPIQHIQVAFTAGYGSTADSVPAPIINAILILLAFLYENRGDAGGEMPMAAQWLMDPYRVTYFGG